MKRTRYFGTLIDPRAGIIALNNYTNLFSLSRELDKSVKKNIHILCGLWWTIETPRQVLKVVTAVIRNRILFPKIGVSILCNTKTEHNLLRFFNISSIYCNHNCFVDENVFTIKSGTAKKFDAVYNAVLEKFKRHTLAKDVDRLALITYKFQNVEYKRFLDESMNHPIWVNYLSGPEPVFLGNDEIADIYNESCVGLALSPAEGAMYSSCEYLLCGIPVVSTKSKGGRDVFFDDYNSKIVPADAQRVAEAVSVMRAAGKDPYRIRNRAIEIMKEQRAEFIRYVNSILREYKFDYDIADSWDKWYINKLRTEMYADDLAMRLNENF